MIDNMQETIERLEAQNAQHALFAIEFKAVIERLRDEIAQHDLWREAAYKREAEMERREKSYLSELADYATTTERLNRRVRELTDAIANYRKWYDTCSYDLSDSFSLMAACDASTALDVALSGKGVRRG